MSEQINVDHAFDPQARQAQAEFDAYLQARPYKDAGGTPRNPENNKFINDEKYFDAARAEHKYGTRDAADYEQMSMTKLAKELGQAELDEDPTRIGDIEDVLYTKMDDFLAKAQEKNDNKLEEEFPAEARGTSDEQTEEDRTTAGNNLLDRIMKAKEAYKTSVTGVEADKADKPVEKPAEKAAATEEAKANEATTKATAETETPAEVKKAAATLHEYDTKVEPGALFTAADKLVKLEKQIADAEAAGDTAKAASLKVERDAVSDDMDDLLGKVAKGRRKHPATDTNTVAPSTELLNEEDGLRMRREDLMQEMGKAYNDRDILKLLDLQKEIDAIDARAKVRGYTTVTPTQEQPAVDDTDAEAGDNTTADAEVVEEDDSEPAKVGRIRRGWRNLKQRVMHAGAGQYGAAFGRNKKAPLAPLQGPTAPIDPNAPFNPINPNNVFKADAYMGNPERDDPKNNTKLYIGAAVLGAAGMVVAAWGAYKGHELMNAVDHIKEQQDLLAQAVARRANNVNKAHQIEEQVKYFLKGAQAVEQATGLKPGQPGFDEAMKQAIDLAWNIENAPKIKI